jgi:hypothetical protein
MEIIVLVCSFFFPEQVDFKLSVVITFVLVRHTIDDKKVMPLEKRMLPNMLPFFVK